MSTETPLDISLAGRIAVVTGAARGLGQGIAQCLARQGASVAALDRDDATKTVASLMVGSDCAHAAIQVDVSSPEEVGRAFADIDQQFPQIDILVNCAGIREIDSILELDPTMWQQVLAINLGGPFLCSQQAARRMAARGRGGAIVNITSVAGLVATTRRPAYSASKHGLIGLTKNMARDLAEHRIRVNAVAPGTVRTPLTEPYYHDEAFLRGMDGIVPLGFEGSPEDVARAVLFFVSDLSPWVAGTVLPVDGGWLAERNYAPPGSSAYLARSSGAVASPS